MLICYRTHIKGDQFAGRYYSQGLAEWKKFNRALF